MELWSTIDLVNAIHTSEELKQKVLKKLARGIASLARCSKVITKRMTRTTSCPDVLAHTHALRNALISVFARNKSKLYKKSLAQLDAVIDALITPVNIDAQVPA